MSRLGTAVLAIALLVGAAPTVMAGARTEPIKIGVLTDMAGPYSDDNGPGDVIAAKLAIADVGGKIGNLPIELISADMQLSVDLATTIARKWVDIQGVDLIMDVPSSAAALAVAEIAKSKDRILVTSGASTDITGKACNANTIQWAANNYAYGSAMTKALLADGGKTWFYITADYVFGIDLETISKSVLKANGGTVLGGVRHPLGAVDQSSAVLQAISSNADVIGLANGGSDTQNTVKQLSEFGWTANGKQKVAMFTTSVPAVVAIGLEKAQGMYAQMSWYWDLNEGSRGFSERFMKESRGVPPSFQQASVYSSLMQYFKAMKQSPTMSGSEAVRVMKSMPTNDTVFGPGMIRANGSHIHPLYLFVVKSPAESKGKWDVLKFVAAVPGDKAFPPEGETGCHLTK